MSQLIAFRNANGIVLGTDASAVRFQMDGQMTVDQIQRLHPLTPRTAILAGGARDGDAMCRAFHAFIEQEGISDIDDVYNAALPFLASEYESFLEKNCDILPVEPIHHVYFILAGVSDTDPEDPYRMHLLWPRNKLPYLDAEPIASAFSVPRVMRLEYQLGEMAKGGAPLEKVIESVREGLDRQAEVHDEIGGPMTVAAITRDGLQRV